MLFGQKNKMCDGTSKNENTVECQRHQEQVEVSVVSLTHTVAHPGAMMIKPKKHSVNDCTNQKLSCLYLSTQLSQIEQ